VLLGGILAPIAVSKKLQVVERRRRDLAADHLTGYRFARGADKVLNISFSATKILGEELEDLYARTQVQKSASTELSGRR
jgi:hypothetical protein